jgi:hypothetical protein
MHMPNRTAKFVSIVFASLVAGAALTTMSHGQTPAAPAADDCLAGPKDHTPQGAHWYYRIEHPSNRHCWYLKGEQDKVAQTASPDASAPAKPMAPATEAAMPRSVADAHAELPAPPTPDAAVSPPANAADPNAQRSIVATRWLDPSSVSSSARPLTGDDRVAAAPSNSAAALPAAVAAVPLAVADALPEEAEKSPGSLRMVLLAIIGALSLAGLMGSAISRFGGRTWRSGRRDHGNDRRAIWDSAAIERGPPPGFPHLRTRMPGADILREPRAADDPNRRIAEMLAQLARKSRA